MPTWCGLYFQNSVGPLIEQLIFFHDHTIIVLIIIMILVGYILVVRIIKGEYNWNVYEGHELESVWTVIPAIFLLLIAFPSLRLLYLIEEIDNPDIRLKVMGHQWYWSYEYGDLGISFFDSYIKRERERLYRLLEVDNRVVIPFMTRVRIVITRMDVIHAWTIPSVGVKVDAIPGRLNQINLIINRIGVFVGQCSEICGANHRFIPIVVGVIPRSIFLNKLWNNGRVIGVSLLN